MNYDKYNEEYNKIISEDSFFYFLLGILKNYNNYLFNNEKDVKRICEEIFAKNDKNIDINHMFETERFLNDIKSYDINFYSAFFST